MEQMEAGGGRCCRQIGMLSVSSCVGVGFDYFLSIVPRLGIGRGRRRVLGASRRSFQRKLFVGQMCGTAFLWVLRQQALGLTADRHSGETARGVGVGGKRGRATSLFSVGLTFESVCLSTNLW